MTSTDFSAAFRECLAQLDVNLMRKLWPTLAGQDDDKVLISMHMARTASMTMPFRHRAFSHRWLVERSLHSMLPEGLKAKAEQMEPKTVRAVGISVNTTSELLRPLAVEVRTAMECAVLDLYADDPELSDDELVRRRLQEAKASTLKTLLGR